MSTLSERVRTILDEHPELDQLAFGRIAGVTKGAVTQWLSGDIKSMKLEYAVRIQKRLGYSALWLVLDDGPQKIGKSGPSAKSKKRSQNPPLSSAASELIQCVGRLDGRIRDAHKTFKLLTGLLLLTAAHHETHDVKTAEELVTEAEELATEILAEPTGTRPADATKHRKSS